MRNLFYNCDTVMSLYFTDMKYVLYLLGWIYREWLWMIIRPLSRIMAYPAVLLIFCEMFARLESPYFLLGIGWTGLSLDKEYIVTFDDAKDDKWHC